MAKHATLSASASSRWMKCPGSLRMIDALPPNARDRRSSYADEGTAAHALGEDALRTGARLDQYRGLSISVSERGDTMFHQAAEAPRGAFAVSQDMIDAVQVYIDEATYHLNRLPGASMALEQRLSLEWLRPRMFGTADLIIDQPFGELVVADYKHGAGVVVEVEWNTQAMYYGLGALARVGGPADVSCVTLVVVQPRARHADGPVRRWSISGQALWDWGRELGLAADRTRAPDATLAAGEWCRFCPVKPTCSEARAHVQRKTQAIFAPVVQTEPLPLPDVDDPARVAEALNAVTVIDSWCRGVEKLAEDMLRQGRTVPGYKLVRKRANRRWRDEGGAVVALEAAGVPRERCHTVPELISPAQVEKLPELGRPKDRKAFVAKLAEKPEGGLTVAHETDKRPAEPPALLTAFVDTPEAEKATTE